MYFLIGRDNMEIGSDFWECTDPLNSNNEAFWNIGKDRRYTLSGRTAIYYCLKNIICKRKNSEGICAFILL